MNYTLELEQHIKNKFTNSLFELVAEARDGSLFCYCNTNKTDNIIKFNISVNLKEAKIDYSLQINHKDEAKSSIAVITKEIDYTTEFYIPNSIQEFISFLNDTTDKKFLHKEFKNYGYK